MPPTSRAGPRSSTTWGALTTRAPSSPRPSTRWSATSARRPSSGATSCPRPCDILEAMTASADRVVGMGQVTVEQIGVGPRSSEAVVELETFSIQAGGAVGTTLATVCALGGQASYFGRLSDDEFGSMIVRGLMDFGVDMSAVLTEPGKISPTSFILVDERTGRRLMRFTRGSTTPLDPGELPRKLLDGARLLLVDGRNPTVHIAAAEKARAQGVTVVLDARRLGGGMGEL